MALPRLWSLQYGDGECLGVEICFCCRVSYYPSKSPELMFCLKYKATLQPLKQFPMSFYYSFVFISKLSSIQLKLMHCSSPLPLSSLYLPLVPLPSLADGVCVYLCVITNPLPSRLYILSLALFSVAVL